jgi:hypothetical protein
LQEEIIGFLALRHPLNVRGLDGNAARAANRGGYRLCNILLKRKNIVERAIKAPCPPFEPRLSGDQMRMNAGALPLTLNRSFDQVGDAEFPSNVRRWQIAAPEMERRGAARDQQLWHLAERGDEFINHAVGKIIRAVGTAQRLKWQDGDPGLAVRSDRSCDRRRGRIARCPSVQQLRRQVLSPRVFRSASA